MRFLGYRRPDGRLGIRNHLVIMSSVVCANEVTERIAQRVPGSVVVVHSHGCCQLPPDLELVRNTLVGLGTNPNVGGVLVVGLGCEGVSGEDVATSIGASGKPVEWIKIQECGYTKAVERGVELAHALSGSLHRVPREEGSEKDLLIGIKCGASDTTSGLVSNPAVGLVGDRLLDDGASVIFGETTEFIGAEHLLARRAVSDEVRQQLYRIVSEMERRAESMGVDMRGGQPTLGNIRGGLTTIEEKSLGAVCKSGSHPIQGVVDYGQRPAGRGLYIMDSPGREPELLTGLASAGAQVILFSTGLGAPQGHPIVPVIKITGNPRTAQRLAEHIDVDVSEVITVGGGALDVCADAICDCIERVAKGEFTKAELLGYCRFCNIYTRGPVI